ncbi:hypothetical protein HPB49_002783 [Dermacentor silvarum]|uniref:Uncharacterized protein n=1 Tax=Dermacentor silvarum TaxID=543639 RepID=A0ACB8DA88_DERSI|nr:hypothetical protein HPB49_002783 [Dermacentor silvarum]
MATVSMDEFLIAEVRQRPILYDQRLKTHRDSQLRNDAWLEISAVLKREAHIFSTLARINFAHIGLQSNNVTAVLSMQFQFRRFPHPSLPKDIPNYAGVIGLILMIGFLVPFCLRVQAMVQENANGLKRLMGLSDAAYWSSHFCSHLLLALLQSAAAVLCMLLVAGPDSDDAFLGRVDPWLLALTFSLFSVIFSLHTILVASFFTNGKYTQFAIYVRGDKF